MRVRVLALAGFLAVLLVACAADTNTGPTGDPPPEEAASSNPGPSAGVVPDASADGGGGISLAEADLDLLRQAFADYEFEMATEPDRTGSGGNLWTGTAHDAQVEVAIIESGGVIEQVGVFDYSAGEVGLDELGFLIGIFAPEAESWLVDLASQALDDPGTELRVRERFDLVTLEFNAFVDETASLDLWVEAPEDS